MHLHHFEQMEPICPRCRHYHNLESPLLLHRIDRQLGERILEGALLCSAGQCQSEYPIIDGIPVLVADLRTWVSHQIDGLMWRDDLGEESESLLGDCCGPGSAFDAIRQNLSSYAFSHYHDLAPPELQEPGFLPNSLLQLLEHALALAAESSATPPAGPILDLGCAVGRTTFELAQRSEELVLGIDLNFSLLRLAARLLHSGEIAFPLRRVGLVYQRQAFAIPWEGRERIDFWACDATALPFRANRFARALSLNLLDCLRSPYDHLLELERLLRPGGEALLATPYDWSASATPVEAWLGGHSQRTAQQGASDARLRELLTPGRTGSIRTTLQLRREIAELPWRLRLHDRSEMHYRVHLLLLESVLTPPPSPPPLHEST